MNHGRGLILAMMVAFAATACASAGGGGETGTPETGNTPRDNSYTNAAGVHLVQAGLSEGEQATTEYQGALEDAIAGIEADSTNPKSYLQAGQAAIGLGNWVQADTMLAKALELNPGYQERIVSEREQAWVDSYNAGAEALNAGNTDRAIELFEAANQMYQGRPEARMALGSLYMNRGNTAAAAEAYTGALDILSGAPPEGLNEEQLAGWDRDHRVAAFNAAQLHAESGNFEKAASILQGYLDENQAEMDQSEVLRARTALAGFLAQAGRDEEAEALYNEIAQSEDLTSAEYFQIGIGYFNTGDYAQAADAFKKTAELNPYSRDALLNLVQSLYSQAVELEEAEQGPERDAELSELYDELLAAAEEVRALDPLNRNLLSFMLRSLRAKADLAAEGEARALTRRTQELYRTYQQQPYEVSSITVTAGGQGQTMISGQLTNLTGTAGSEVQLRFALLDQQGNQLDASTVTVEAPEQNVAVQFNTTLDVPPSDFAGWMYEVVN